MMSLIASIVITMFAIVVPVATAQTPSPTAQSSPSATMQQQVRELREKVESRVEKMRKSDQKAYAGVIEKMTGSAFTLISRDGVNEKKLSITTEDKITQFYAIAGSAKKEIKREDLSDGDYVIVTGALIDNTISATEIYRDEQFNIATGKIIEVNKSEYSVKVLTAGSEEFMLDIETATKQYMVNVKTLEIEKTGFSKLKEGDAVQFVVSKSNPGQTKEKNRYTARRVLVLPQELFIK